MVFGRVARRANWLEIRDLVVQGLPEGVSVEVAVTLTGVSIKRASEEDVIEMPVGPGSVIVAESGPPDHT